MGYEEWESGDGFDGKGGRPLRTCERCGCGSGDDHDRARPEPMMAEVQLAFGLNCWICHDCRKDWYRIFKEHPLNRAYSHATFKLEFWKAKVGGYWASIEEDDADDRNTFNIRMSLDDDALLKDGLKLLDAIEDLELEINCAANKWLLGGIDEIRSK